MRIDPWGSSGYQDYARLRDEFGIASFGPAEWGVFRTPHPLFQRGVVFGHRDFARVQDAVKRRDPWTVMTGFMPSGDLHLGHKMVLEQVIAHTKEGAEAVLCLADFEAMAARGMSAEKTQSIALDQYVHNALALGLDAKRPPFYFQTKRRRVRDLADRLAQKVNWSTLSALYGFTGETTLGHANAPLVQSADILHSQLDTQGPRPVLVPVGVDQDPHIRLTRDLAQDWRKFSLLQQGDNLVVAVKGSEDVARWLDVAEKVLLESGIGTRTKMKRNEAHGQVSVSRPGGSVDTDEGRALDQALAKAEAREGGIAMLRPSATFHRFMTGLQGGKMSSSKPETSIYLTEPPKTAEKKVMGAVTGGRATVEEQRRLGANPDICPVYELYLYHVAKDDSHLQEVRSTCMSGARLCGGCKKEAAGLLLDWMKQHKEKRDQVAHNVTSAISQD